MKRKHTAPYTLEVVVKGDWFPLPAYWANPRDAMLHAVRQMHPRRGWRLRGWVGKRTEVLYTAEK